MNRPWRRSASCPNSQRSAKPRVWVGSAPVPTSALRFGTNRAPTTPSAFAGSWGGRHAPRWASRPAPGWVRVAFELHDGHDPRSSPTEARMRGEEASNAQAAFCFFEDPLPWLYPLPTSRKRDWSAGLRPGSILRPDTNVPDRRPALQADSWGGTPLGKQTCAGMGESCFRVTRRPQPAFSPRENAWMRGKAASNSQAAICFFEDPLAWLYPLQNHLEI
jgi:hypothetical protein